MLLCFHHKQCVPPAGVVLILSLENGKKPGMASDANRVT